MKKLFAFLFLVAASAGGWYGYQYFTSDGGVKQYRTAEVVRDTIVQTVSATGTVQPVTQVLVGTEVSGTVLRWYCDFNQPVKQNEILAELDPDRFKRVLDQRTASLAVSKANLEQARARHSNALRERVRMERLAERKSASDTEVANAAWIEQELRAAVLSAEAQVAVVEAEKNSAEVDMSKTVIRSPIDGVVIKRAVDAGQTVAASLQTPELFTIAADLTRMRVFANVSETDIGQVREGMKAEFTVDAYPGRKFVGRVSQVRYNPTIVENVVTYEALIDVDNDDLALRPGLTATIAFEVDRADSVVTVANAALRFRPMSDSARPGAKLNDSPTVYKLENNKPVAVEIRLGINDGTRSQVLDGELAEGAKLIVEEITGAARRPTFSRMVR